MLPATPARPRVHVTADFAPHRRRRDVAVARALAAEGCSLLATGSPYAADPGSVSKPDGNGYAPFIPFRRAWEAQVSPPIDPGRCRVALPRVPVPVVDHEIGRRDVLARGAAVRSSAGLAGRPARGAAASVPGAN